jgi:hypothetical protein
MNETFVHVCRVSTSDGLKDYVTLEPPEVTGLSRRRNVIAR